MTTFRLAATEQTVRIGSFDPTAAPVLEVESGDVVDFETLTLWAGRLAPDSTLESMMRLRDVEFPGIGPHSITGPVAVRGALPGQVLKVDVLELTPIEHGYNFNYPGEFGTGLLPDAIATGGLRHLDLDLATMTTRLGGVTVPLQPFLGIMGVAPRDDGVVSSIPPGDYGGNLDLRELVAGSTLYLPIWRPGANFSVGDAHARQGNGEVCLSAIETAFSSAKLRLTVVDDLQVVGPMAETPTHWITIGMDPDLLTASHQAALGMVRFLQSRYGLEERDAYGLCSIAGDLSVTQVVNTVRGTHLTMPKSLFS